MFVKIPEKIRRNAENLEKAFELYKQAAASNMPVPLVGLGTLYLEGTGTPKNPRKAVDLFQQAAKLGDAQAKYELGVCYLDGLGGLPQDRQKAISLISEAAAANIEDAKTVLEQLQSAD